MQSPVTLYATLISPGVSLTHPFPARTLTDTSGVLRKSYIHVVQTSGYNPSVSTGATVIISGDGTLLKEGDGAYIHGETGEELKIENVGESVAEVLLFDVE